MDLLERCIWLLIGGAIGFIAGYVVRSLKKIEEKVGEMVDEYHHDRDERGAIRLPPFKHVAVFLVVVLTAFAAFQSQRASHSVVNTQEALIQTQEDQGQLTRCTSRFFAKTITALNERTTYSREQSKANVNLQKAQAEYLGLILSVPTPDPVRLREALTKYFNSLTRFVRLTGKSDDKASKFSYPTVKKYRSCLRAEPKEDKDE